MELTPSLLKRFLAKIIDSSDCWEWLGKTGSLGYGTLRYHDGEIWKTVKAHRVAYELLNGPIPEGLVIDHLCRNKGCVNPYHLDAVTVGENSARGNRDNGPLPRAKRNGEDTCHRGHLLRGKNLYTTPNGRRNCQTCRREANKRWLSNQHTEVKSRGQEGRS